MKNYFIQVRDDGSSSMYCLKCTLKILPFFIASDIVICDVSDESVEPLLDMISDDAKEGVNDYSQDQITAAMSRKDRQAFLNPEKKEGFIDMLHAEACKPKEQKTIGKKLIGFTAETLQEAI